MANRKPTHGPVPFPAARNNRGPQPNRGFDFWEWLIGGYYR